MPSIFCTISGLVTDPNGRPMPGALIRIERAIVSGSRNATYEASAVSSATGAFSFTVPQGARLRFQSYDVASIDGWTLTAPSHIALNIGNFQADIASEVGQRGITPTGSIAAAVAPYVQVREVGDVARQLIFTLTACPVTLVKNGTSTGGGGSKLYTLPEGLVLPKGGSSNLTIAAAGDKSFLAAVGTTEQGTGGSLATTTSNILPSTAATTSSGAGTCKMKSTVSIPVPGTPMDGSSSAISLWLNACLNADATGVEALTFSGTITVNFEHLGDN